MTAAPTQAPAARDVDQILVLLLSGHRVQLLTDAGVAVGGRA